MIKELMIKDFEVNMTYDEAVIFLKKKGYRMLTFNEWAYNRKKFSYYSWLKAPKVPRGAARVLALGYYLSCIADGDIGSIGRVVGVKTKVLS